MCVCYGERNLKYSLLRIIKGRTYVEFYLYVLEPVGRQVKIFRVSHVSLGLPDRTSKFPKDMDEKVHMVGLLVFFFSSEKEFAIFSKKLV